MPEFHDIRAQLNQLRTDSEGLRTDLFHARQRLRQLEAAQQALDRRFDPDNPRHQAEQNRLKKAQDKIRSTIEQLDKQLGSLQADLEGVWQVFQPLVDPRERIGAFDSRIPILLFPLRIETRFKTLTVAGRPANQLWVRIFPDDCMVDSFEPTPSETEIQDLQRYWSEIWWAGGDPDLRRGAWRNLAASHGAGRSVYLSEQYLPLPASDPEPIRASREEIILVVPTETPLTAPGERDALVLFWTSVWRAGDDAAALQSAFDALVDAVGPGRAGELQEQYPPFNLGEAPAAGVDRATIGVQVVVVVFTAQEDLPSKTASWTRAARVDTLPERFVLIGDSGAEHIEIPGNAVRSPLFVGPDPLETPDQQFQTDADGNLVVPASLRWMTDFDEAVAAGMGFRVNLSPEQAKRGFDRLYVVGLRLSADAEDGRALLENLLLHQQQGSNGLALVPQGTPTNNTEPESSGYSTVADPDELYDIMEAIRQNGWQFDPTESDPFRKRDGLWLAEHLGVDPAIFQKTPHAAGADQSEARAMNTALFPATLGYWLDTQLQPVFSNDAIGRVRDFFNQYVSGRGALPAIRIGRQPYGILPATNFSNLEWLAALKIHSTTGAIAEDPQHRFLRNLYRLLKDLDTEYWQNFADKAVHVDQQNANPQQLMLDLVGLHPTSVEFYQQWAESLDHLWNRLQFMVFMPWLPQWQKIMALVAGGPALLQQLGYTGTPPELLEKIFVDHPNLLKGAIVDADPAVPFSETEVLRAATPDGKNYIQWLIDKAGSNMDDLRAQRGFTDNKPPTALLYLKLRHALELGYYDLNLVLHRRANLVSDQQVTALRHEPAFVHVAEQVDASESRYQMLYAAQPAITGNTTQLMAEYIPTILHQLSFEHYLPKQIEALQYLAQTPTARLERLFAEHIDCCTYRWDAWMLGLAHYRLRQLRAAGNDDGAGRGIYLGAFAWVEDLRPDHSVQQPVTLSDELDAIFHAAQEPQLMRDNQNGGFVHAPSLNHAVTAAVLRNGYLHNATPSDPGLMAVNLSSERVRIAMQFIEGIRNGQPLGALLGYQFERGLHDRYAEAEVDTFIFEIRKAFPLRARRIKDTLPDDDEAVEKIEARNVVDGLRMVEHVRASSVKTYPWGKNLQRGTAQQEAVINSELNRLLEIQDAIADLAVAESVHQAVQGNYDRAAAALDAYSRASFPPDPDVAKTPRSGVTLTHRVGLHIPALAVPGSTPRSAVEPGVNAWLAAVLPPMSDVVVAVEYQDPPGAPPAPDTVSWQDLQLEPIDLVYRLQIGQEQAMSEVDDRVYQHLLAKHNLRPDAEIALQYTRSVPGKVTFFEIQPLVASLRALLLESKPLTPGDVAMPNEASSADEEIVFVPEARIDTARAHVAAVQTAAAALATALEPGALLDPESATEADLEGLAAQVDAWYEQFIQLQRAAGGCGFPLSGFGWAMHWRRQFFDGLIGQSKALGQRWLEKADACNLALLASEVPGLTDEEQFEHLQTAERAIQAVYTLPLPATPAAFRAQVEVKKTVFDADRAQVDALASTSAKTVHALLAAWKALIPLSVEHDLEPIGVLETLRQVHVFVQDLHGQAAGLAVAAQQRLDKADALIAEAAAAGGRKKAQLLSDAGKQLFGEDFKVVWQFQAPAGQGDEWQNAWNDRAQLTSWLESQGVDFPVDDWLYGIARVRPKLRDWENAVQLSGAFGRPEPALQPLQFPYVSGEPWLALDFPPDFDAAATGDRLLYTACYGGGGFDKSGVQCGLLLDEWTEVLPGREETTGLTFHYDRPNNEPPQTMLLAIPATLGEHWEWDDLTAAIRETFVMARKRAVEPRQIESTPLARFLPATIAAVTLRGISISNNLAVNNHFATLLKMNLSDG